MSSDTTEKLTRLLTIFDAQRLGEGNMTAGANVIAAMACAISNIHRHGTCISADDGPSFRVGTSMLAYGPLSSALVSERVESVLAECQANLNDHCNEWETAKEAYLSQLHGREPGERFTVPPDLRSMAVLKEDISGLTAPLDGLLAPLHSQKKRALLERPLIHMTGASPGKLEAAFERSHAGQLLVHDVLRDPSHCAELSGCCLPLIDGCLTVGRTAKPVRGQLLLCDPSQVADEVLRVGGFAGRLLLRMPWLVDGNAGPNPPTADNSSTIKHTRLDRMEERFKRAVTKAWVRRLDFTNDAPEKLNFDLNDCQARWVAFLQQKESDFPGISAAARPLPATLLFGLLELLNSLPTNENVKLYVDDVEDLARMLVLRMCNTRAVILHNATKEERERRLQTMLEKLSTDPSDLRTLVRKHHRLPVAEARDLLGELVSRGKVLDLGGDRYQLASNAPRHEARALTLEV